jgi:hypothetical protein
MLKGLGFTSLLLLAALCAACGGSRKVPPPATPQGYQALTGHDVLALAPTDANIEIVGAVGALASHEHCDGLLTLPLAEPAQSIAGAPAAVARIMVAMTGALGGAVVTLPRTRYAEVRDLKPGDVVRVRGYASTYEAQGCSVSTTGANRFIWVDSIERVPPTPQ